MANKQINELSELTTSANGDLIPVYDIDEAGSEKTKKMEVNNLLKPGWQLAGEYEFTSETLDWTLNGITGGTHLKILTRITSANDTEYRMQLNGNTSVVYQVIQHRYWTTTSETWPITAGISYHPMGEGQQITSETRITALDDSGYFLVSSKIGSHIGGVRFGTDNVSTNFTNGFNEIVTSLRIYGDAVGDGKIEVYGWNV